jgi:hypothetical protein
MAAASSLDLDRDPRSIIGVRELDAARGRRADSNPLIFFALNPAF